jgi:hypothetical protein
MTAGSISKWARSMGTPNCWRRLGDVALGTAPTRTGLSDFAAFFALELQGGLQLLLRDQLLLEEEISELYGHGVQRW